MTISYEASHIKRRIVMFYNLGSGTVQPAKVRLIRAYLKRQADPRSRLVKVTSPKEIIRFVTDMPDDTYDAIGVYAGDGTVLAAIKISATRQIPILILAGGTANTLAAAFNLPLDLEASLKMFCSNQYIIRYADIGRANRRDFVLDLHYGLWAEAIAEANTGLKKKIGQWAYVWKLAQAMSKTSSEKFIFSLDGKVIEQSGYGLMVANGGFQNVFGLPLFPHPHGRGKLQVAIVKTVKIHRLLAWYAWRRFGRLKIPQIIGIYEAKSVIIQKAPSQLIFDDILTVAKLPLEITNGGAAAMIVAPPDTSSPWGIKRLRNALKLSSFRIYESWRRRILGVSRDGYSQISHKLYVGGQYRRSSREIFHKWGITGIVNMRQQRRPVQFDSIELLQLPTRDWQAPSLIALQKGVDFIEKKIDEGGSVYIHCRLGEGRGPTMAAAYLISQGMSVATAIAHIQRFRPVARPSSSQLRQLSRFQEELNRTE